MVLTNFVPSGVLEEECAFPLVLECTLPEADTYVCLCSLHHQTCKLPNNSQVCVELLSVLLEQDACVGLIYNQVRRQK